MITDTLTVAAAEFAARTGWQLKAEGACKGEICVPLSGAIGDVSAPDATVALDVLAEELGLALVHDEQQGLWAVGPETIGSRALATAVAPDLRLPDLDGNEFSLHSLRGRKVVMVAWSPY